MSIGALYSTIIGDSSGFQGEQESGREQEKLAEGSNNTRMTVFTTFLSTYSVGEEEEKEAEELLLASFPWAVLLLLLSSQQEEDLGGVFCCQQMLLMNFR